MELHAAVGSRQLPGAALAPPCGLSRLLLAFGRVACSQGTMNNVIFGDTEPLGNLRDIIRIEIAFLYCLDLALNAPEIEE